MTTDQITSRRSADRLLKSPLAVPGRPGSGAAAAVGVIDVPTTRESLSERAVTRAEFEDYLRTTNNRCPVSSKVAQYQLPDISSGSPRSHSSPSGALYRRASVRNQVAHRACARASQLSGFTCRSGSEPTGYLFSCSP
jgi:hypothetical protein